MTLGYYNCECVKAEFKLSAKRKSMFAVTVRFHRNRNEQLDGRTAVFYCPTSHLTLGYTTQKAFVNLLEEKRIVGGGFEALTDAEKSKVLESSGRAIASKLVGETFSVLVNRIESDRFLEQKGERPMLFKSPSGEVVELSQVWINRCCAKTVGVAAKKKAVKAPRKRLKKKVAKKQPAKRKTARKTPTITRIYDRRSEITRSSNGFADENPASAMEVA